MNANESESRPRPSLLALDDDDGDVVAPLRPSLDSRDAGAVVAVMPLSGGSGGAGGGGGDAISVSVRLRPFTPREAADQALDEFHSRWEHTDTTLVEDSDLARKAYAFDRVHGPAASNEEVYELSAKRVVAMALRGYNGSVLAYGQTGRYGMLRAPRRQRHDWCTTTLPAARTRRGNHSLCGHESVLAF